MDMKLVIRRLGGPKRISEICDLKAPSVYSWVRVPVARCPRLELASGGKVTVEQMRPDVQWRRMKDREWPHPQGRPLVDYGEATE